MQELQTRESLTAQKRYNRFVRFTPANFRLADKDTSSSRLEADAGAGAVEATTAWHTRRRKQYAADSSFVRFRPQRH
jgi:hypothetical protein